MNKETENEVRLTALIKEISDQLNSFPREIMILFYAAQDEKSNLDLNIPQDITLTKVNNVDASKQMNKMMEDAKLKWAYASDKQKKQVAEMEMVVVVGNEKIKQLYAL